MRMLPAPVAVATLVLTSFLPAVDARAGLAQAMPAADTRPAPVLSPRAAPDTVAAPLSQEVLYRFFFRHLAALDELAASRDAVGKGDVWRTHEQRAAGLTGAEGQAMKQVAFDCNRAVAGLDERYRGTLADIRAQIPRGQPMPAEHRAELRRLRQERTQIVRAHVEQLRSALGGASFQKLDAYLHARFHGSLQPGSGTVQPHAWPAPPAAVPAGTAGGVE